MLARLFHKLTTASLVTAILAGSLLSPAVHHAHSGGAVPHSHSAELAGHDASHEHHGHCHDGHTHCPHDRDPSRVPLPGDLADHAVHLHVSLLWFNFTLPLEGNPSESPVPFGEETSVVLRLTPDAVPSSASVLVDLLDQWSTAPARAKPRDASGPSAANSRQRPVDRNLLCDSARGARSGVLLI
jgi:hypothetical protein